MAEESGGGPCPSLCKVGMENFDLKRFLSIREELNHGESEHGESQVGGPWPKQENEEK